MHRSPPYPLYADIAEADNRDSGRNCAGAYMFASITKRLRWSILAIAPALGACVHSSVIPLSQDTLQITAAAAPVCGMTGAQNYAAQLAAVETLRHGYDRYVIVGGGYRTTSMSSATLRL